FADVRYEWQPFNKLVIFDEAHKYIDSPDLVGSLIEVVREMRHKGTSIMVASEDPPSVPGSLILDSGVLCGLALLDLENGARPADNRAHWLLPGRPSPVRCVHAHSGVGAPRRRVCALAPWPRHGSSAIVKIRRSRRQWQTTFPLLRTTAPESRPSLNVV